VILTSSVALTFAEWEFTSACLNTHSHGISYISHIFFLFICGVFFLWLFFVSSPSPVLNYQVNQTTISMYNCPRFGQDSVNFHQNPGRGTAGWADPPPTWPNRARYSIPCAVMLVSGWGGQRSRNSLAAREGSAVVRSERAVLFCGFVLYSSLFCIIVVPVPFVCCSVKLPLSLPTSFLPVYFHSPPHPGRGMGGRVVLLLPAAAKTRTVTFTSFTFTEGQLEIIFTF